MRRHCAGYTHEPPDSPSDRAALDTIHALMNKEQWSPDTLEAIRDVLATTGRPITDSTV